MSLINEGIKNVLRKHLVNSHMALEDIKINREGQLDDDGISLFDLISSGIYLFISGQRSFKDVCFLWANYGIPERTTLQIADLLGDKKFLGELRDAARMVENAETLLREAS